jgi:hypothetical protein
MAKRDVTSTADGPGDAAGVSAKRRGRAIAIGAAAEPLIAPLLRRRGFIETRVACDWPAIVGDPLAAETVPIRLAFPKGERQDATLHVRVTGPMALELQHLAPVVIERINGYFGYKAVSRLTMQQAPLGHVPKRRVRRKIALSPDEERTLADRVAQVSDPALRQSLVGLGRAMQASRRAATPSGLKRAR